MQRNMGNGAAVGDFDNDGDFDVYLLNNANQPRHFYRNDLVNGARVFSDITATTGVNDAAIGRVAFFVDLDNDGLKDLLIINDQDTTGTTPPCRVYKNNGSTFTDMTATSGFDAVGYIKGGACLGDYDGDGLIDIFVGLWLMDVAMPPPTWPGHDRLFRNLGNFQFEDATTAAGLPEINRDTYTCIFADFDNDGDVDLYLAIDHTSDAYFRNDGGFFVEQTVAVGATHKGNDMGLAVGDFDNDGDLDIYSTNITDTGNHFGNGQNNTLLINQLSETGTLTFVDQAVARGVANTYWGWGTEWIDVDNDGSLDLYAVNGFKEFISAFVGPAYPLANTPEVLFFNDGMGHFTRSSGTGADFTTDARCAIAFDYNQDGRQDLLVTSIGQPPASVVLIENQTTPSGHWIDVHLVGTCGFNSDAIGAKVFLQSGGPTYRRDIIAGGSYLSGRPYDLHFGLGVDDVSSVQIRVVWPNRDEVQFTTTQIDRRYTIEQAPDGSAIYRYSVNLSNFAAFQQCFGTTGIEPVDLSQCALTDFNRDGQVDAGDLLLFEEWLSGRVPGCSSQANRR
ncbi:MAG: CRTAC1 family protein [Planctomycetes bacterium]|nr:CRTAC1 family protein [Planctomycetota bacterium]MBI3834461.1 CRTAC1 family protein [Planctomycetota bacterium]